MKITIQGLQRAKPKAGDRRTTKRHGLQIRVQDVARNRRGEAVAYVVSNGRPVYSWCEPRNIEWRDACYLTDAERVQFGFSAPSAALTVDQALEALETEIGGAK